MWELTLKAKNVVSGEKQVIEFPTLYSEIELQRKLQEARVVAGRDDFAKIARVVAADTSGIRINRTPGCRDGGEVADRICKVDRVEKIKKVSTEFDVF